MESLVANNDFLKHYLLDFVEKILLGFVEK